MRDFFSGLVILLIVASMGLLEAPDRDRMVSAGIAAQAQEIAAAQKHPVEVLVDVRDITVSGRVESGAERAALLKELKTIEGVQSVRHELVVLPNAAPFALTIEKTGQQAVASGVVPSVEVSRGIAAALDIPADGLTLATGAPDADWGTVAGAVALALSRLENGQMSISDHSVALTGQAILPATVAALKNELSALPGAYRVTLDLTALDDGAPYSFFASRDPRMGMRVSGKLPPDVEIADLIGPLGQVHDLQVAAAPVDLGLPGFAEAAALGSRMLALLPQGHLVLTGATLTLGGGPLDATGETELRALVAGLPAGFTAKLALVPVDDDTPLGLTILRDEGGLSVSGKAPAGFDPAALAQLLPDAEIALSQSPYPDLTQWGATALQVAALAGHLGEGSVTLANDGVRVDGVVADEAALLALRAAVTELREDIPVEANVDLADAGKPPRFVVTYDAVQGASVDGILPKGLDLALIAQALGLADVGGDERKSKLGEPAQIQKALRVVRAWLPEAENLFLTFDQGDLTLTGVLSPGADAELILKETRDAVDWQKRPLLQLLTSFPKPETVRMNAALQAEQIFLAGFWLPRLDFEPSLEACRAFTGEALGQGGVNFLSGSRRLDARAVRVINRISAVARRCVNDGGLQLEIGGHTDNVGSARDNRRLSNARARTVAQAIGLRGVDAAGLQALGHGADLPIADNATREGRAANRRITFDWPGPLDDAQ